MIRNLFGAGCGQGRAFKKKTTSLNILKAEELICKHKRVVMIL
jgi:hypothetical protein